MVATVGAGAMQAVGTLASAGQASAAADFEADQYRIQAQQQRTAAAQEEAQRREELTSNLETIQAIRAGRGVGSNSPTGNAILTSTTEDEMRDMRIARLNMLERADLSQRAAFLSRRRGQTSLLTGNLSAGADILNSATRAYSGGAYATARRY